MRYNAHLHDRLIRVVDTYSASAIPAKNKAQRGNVNGISNKSRSRLMRLLAMVNRSDPVVFLTLTYREWVDDWEVWKRDLDTFGKALRRRFPVSPAIWRMEFQEREAPHWHILLWPCDEKENAASVFLWARRVWLRIIGQDTKANWDYGVTCSPVEDLRQSAFYISVYQSKDKNDRKDTHTGREWGVWNKDKLGLEPMKTVEIDEVQLRVLRRVMRGAYRAHKRKTFRNSFYFRGLKSEQPFTSFLPFEVSNRLFAWIATSVPPGPEEPFRTTRRIEMMRLHFEHVTAAREPDTKHEHHPKHQTRLPVGR